MFRFLNHPFFFNTLGPNGRPVPVQKSTLQGQTYTVTADQVGEHTIQILYNGKHIKGSPFRYYYYLLTNIIYTSEIQEDFFTRKPAEIHADICYLKWV